MKQGKLTRGRPSKKLQATFKDCSFYYNIKNKISHVLIPMDLFHSQFDNYNEDNLFFELFEWMDEVNEG
jgi:hypothetical protein